jgi:hypothetical protein
LRAKINFTAFIHIPHDFTSWRCSGSEGYSRSSSLVIFLSAYSKISEEPFPTTTLAEPFPTTSFGQLVPPGIPLHHHITLRIITMSNVRESASISTQEPQVSIIPSGRYVRPGGVLVLGECDVSPFKSPSRLRSSHQTITITCPPQST